MPERGDAAGVRRRVLERAASLFQRRGLSSVTMDEIAASLGMSKKTLYQHFAGKDDLAAAVIDREFDDLERDLAAVTEAEAPDFAARLQRYFATLADRYRRLDGPLLDDIERAHPHLHARFRERGNRAVETAFGRLFAAGVAAGELRADLDPSVVVRVVQGMSAALSAPAPDSSIPPSELFATTFDILLHGIRVRPEAASGGSRPSRA